MSYSVFKQNSIVWLFFVLGISGGFFLMKFTENNRMDLVIDAKIEKGHRIEVYINKEWSRPLVQSIEYGKRHQYMFKNIPSRLFHLRLDPADVENSEIIIYGISLQKAGKTLLLIPPQEIAKWCSYCLFNVKENFAYLFSTNKDPVLQQDLKAVFAPAILGIFDIMADPKFVLFLLMAVCIAYTVPLNSRIGLYKFLYLLSVLFSSYLLAWKVSTMVLDRGGDIPDVLGAIGYASYAGISKSAEIYAFWLSVAIIGIFVIAASFGWEAIKRRFQLKQNIEFVSREGTFSFSFLAFILIGYAVLTFPHLRALHDGAGMFVHSTQYDSQNVITWEYFRHIGLRPFRDFWYPYSGFYYMSLPYPPDSIYRWFHGIILFSVFEVSIYKLLGFSKLRTLSVLSFAAWLILLSLAVLTDRYFLSLSIVLLFAACVEAGKKPLFIFCGIYVFYVFFMEGVQLVYAIPGCLLILTAGLFLKGKTSDRVKLLKNICIGLAVTAMLISAYMAYLAYNNALGEFLRFYLTMGNLAEYSMVPANVAGWFFAPGSESLLLILTFGLMSLSLWYLLSEKHRVLEIRDFVPLAIAILTLVVFKKQLVRPHSVYSTIGLPAMGLAMMVAKSKLYIRPGVIKKGVLLFTAGMFIQIFVISNGSAETIWSQYILGLHELPNNIRLALKEAVWKDVKDSYFAPSSFFIDRARGDELRVKILEKMKFEKDDDLFVLGDDAYLYIILDKVPPFYISFYNQSIIYSQLDTVEWLKAHRPEYVIWRSSFKEFDGVPNIVRVPFIFEEVMNNYIYSDNVGEFLILRRRQPGESVDFDFWRKHLGETVDLSYIPSRSMLLQLQGSEGTYVPTVLTITIPKPIQGRIKEIGCYINGELYLIRFKERNDIVTYNILLDRIWFWRLARDSGMKPLLVTNKKDRGIFQQVKLVNLTLSKEILY